MSERELNRIEVLSDVVQGRLSAVAAASVLGLSRRQVHRLLKTFQADGPAAIRHKARGRPSNNRIDPAVREFALTLIRERYADFGPTFAAEKLAEDHGLKVSRETLRKWMQDAGIWLSRKQRRTFHQPRRRRDCYGELVQIDGSDHAWFEERGPACTLLAFVDDATSTLMHLEFVGSESTFSYFGALERYLAAHGRPVAFYSDKHSVFRVAKQGAKSGHGMTQFGRALNDLNIEILCANSSQAKGRVERANRTLQDRLMKELRLAGVCDMAAGNAILPRFLARHNAKFAKAPLRADNLHRSLNMRELANERRRFGYRRLFVLLRREGEPSGINRIYRLYREEGLTVHKRKARRKAVGTRAPILVEARPNARWSLDFVHDQFANGLRFRVLNVVDDVTRECLAAIPDTSISGRRVARELTALIERHGKPGMIVSDNVLCRENLAA